MVPFYLLKKKLKIITCSRSYIHKQNTILICPYIFLDIGINHMFTNKIDYIGINNKVPIIKFKKKTQPFVTFITLLLQIHLVLKTGYLFSDLFLI